MGRSQDSVTPMTGSPVQPLTQAGEPIGSTLP